MSGLGHKRKFLRAPLNSYFLYEDDNFIYKSKLSNISEEGVLIESLPHFPGINIIAAFLDIPKIPVLDQISLDKIRDLLSVNFEREIHRARIKTLRRSEQTTSVEQIFIKNIGAQIQNVSSALRASIAAYVATYATNLIFLLKLLENPAGDEERIDKIRSVSRVLGYDESAKISLIHQKVLQDYKSLQW